MSAKSGDRLNWNRAGGYSRMLISPYEEYGKADPEEFFRPYPQIRSSYEETTAVTSRKIKIASVYAKLCPDRIYTNFNSIRRHLVEKARDLTPTQSKLKATATPTATKFKLPARLESRRLCTEVRPVPVAVPPAATKTDLVAGQFGVGKISHRGAGRLDLATQCLATCAIDVLRRIQFIFNSLPAALEQAGWTPPTRQHLRSLDWEDKFALTPANLVLYILTTNQVYESAHAQERQIMQKTAQQALSRVQHEVLNTVFLRKVKNIADHIYLRITNDDKTKALLQERITQLELIMQYLH